MPSRIALIRRPSPLLAEGLVTHIDRVPIDPASAELFSDLGYTPVPVDISEFEKLEGCVTCLSVRVRELSDGDEVLP